MLISEQNLRCATELADRASIIERSEIRYEARPPRWPRTQRCASFAEPPYPEELVVNFSDEAHTLGR